MPEVIDTFSFDKGINLRKNPVALTDGEMQICNGFCFLKDGQLLPIPSRGSMVNLQLGTVRNIHRYINWVYVQEGSNVAFKWDLNGYCNLYTPPDANFTTTSPTEAQRARFVDYKTWTFMVNGFRNLALNGENAFNWALPNPSVPPTVEPGVGGCATNGTYTCYYTFLFKFPNGEVYESGPSPPADVTVSSQAIYWKNLEKCSYSPDIVNYWSFMDWYVGPGGYSLPVPTNPITLMVLYAAYSFFLTSNGNVRSVSSGVVQIWRRLYRYSTTLGAIYFAREIQDNNSTSLEEGQPDSEINLNDILSTTEYSPIPDDVVAAEAYLQRIFYVKKNLLGWSEPFLPFSFKSTSSVAVSDEGNYLTGCVFWGDTLYMPSKAGWRRLSGTDPDTWAVREVFADRGIINPDTVQKTKFGILGLWYDGICLFDGATSRNITEKQIGTDLFLNTIGRANYASCWATYDGTRYRFYYPNGCLVIDFSYYPDIRMYRDPLILTAHEYHDPTGIEYMAYNGYQYINDPAGDYLSVSLVTGEKVGQNILQRKNLKYLYYDIDTGGYNVTVLFTIDGVVKSPIFTLNTTTRTRDRLDLPDTFEGYRISLEIDCATARGTKPTIYAPWAIQSTLVGL